MADELIPDFAMLRRKCESEGVAFPEAMFSPYRVQVSKNHADTMAEIVKQVERVAALEDYQEKVLQWAPAIAGYDPGVHGVFFGYDFHIGDTGPKLIEINTNAGGAYLNVLLLRAWGLSSLAEDTLFEMFLEEWSLVRRGRILKQVAIVDDDCLSQFLYPEFCLFKKLFESRGISAVIIDAKDLEYRDGILYHNDLPIDLVYNRLTDFPLELEAHRALKTAYLDGAVVLTPHPRAHALFADKRNLSVLSDPASLAAFGLPDAVIELLSHGIAKTRIVSCEDPEELWQERRKLFFKPDSGYGAKAVYRGDKLTRRVWGEILGSSYVCQEYVPPMEMAVFPAEEPVRMKYDYRNFVYRGRVQLLAARLYQGQTTNFRTEGGGFAPVFIAS